jgi:hypothetical protein
MLFYAGILSFSSFLFFSCGSDNRCREFSATLCCTVSMMLGDKNDGDSEKFICKLLAGTNLDTEYYELLIKL